MKSDSASLGWLIIISVVTLCLYKGIFYQTGAQWHEACWYANHSENGPKTPDDDAAWSQCRLSANRAFYEAGLVITTRKPITPVMQAIDKVCPSSQYSPFNISQTANESITGRGGPDIWDKLLPASWTLNKTFTKLYPQCSAVRQANGVPKMVEQKDSGWFDWASPCAPCEVEGKAIAAQLNAPAPGPYTLLESAPSQPALPPAPAQ